MSKYRAVETTLGIINGRDTIYLDEITLVVAERKLILRGEFNGPLCSKATNEDFIPYELIFSRVSDHKLTDLDSFGFAKGISSFDEVVQGGAKREYLVRTYDDVLEVVCDSYQLNLLSNDPPRAQS